MKHLAAYKSLCLLIAFLALGTSGKAQSADAREWVIRGDWKHGLKPQLVEPVNAAEFANQYKLNKVAWDKAFAFLRDSSLVTMQLGKHVIDGDNVYAMISEALTKIPDSVKWEAHRRYIDLHYVISGAEYIGVADIAGAKVTRNYDATKDVANYSSDGKYYLATPGVFYLFFPSDIHRPTITTDGRRAMERKVVIKIKYIR